LRLGSYYRWLLSDSLGLLPDSGDRVLDVGCYDGYLLSHCNCDLRVAVDLEPAADSYFPVWKANGRRLPFADEAFDRVYLLDVIEHVIDYATVLGEAVRVLRTSGVLWVSTPSLYWWVVPPQLTALLDRRWGHVRRGHTVQDIQDKLPSYCQVRAIQWSMPYFRTFYFPVRLLWNAWPATAQRILSWVAKRDRHSRPGPYGHLFVQVYKGS
jgi:SAM-dependent methyltransferase